MSLDDRLREGLPRVAAGVEPEVDGALRDVVTAGRRRRNVYRAGIAVAALAVLGAGIVTIPRAIEAFSPEEPGRQIGGSPQHTVLPTENPPESPTPPAASYRCGDDLPLHPAYLPDGFEAEPVAGPAPGAPPAEEGQFVLHWTDGERAFEIRHPGTFFAEITGETGQRMIEVLGYETIPPAPVVPMETDYIVQFMYRPQAAGEAVADLGERDCDLWSVNEYGLPPDELERVAIGLAEGAA
jgi:hypothetical protein